MYAFKLLKDKKCKSCDRNFTMVPKDYRPWDEAKGLCFECDCKNTLFIPLNDVDTSQESCDCHDCEDSETPCFYVGDCGEDMCIGCMKATLEMADRDFDEKKAMGYL